MIQNHVSSDAPAPASRRAVGLDSSLARMLATLRLFTRDESVLAAETIAQRLGVPTSTAYRYVKQLATEGLLVRWKGGYTLGPRISELDLQMREADPLIRAAITPMRQLVRACGMEVLLSKLYGSTVMTIHIEGVDNLPHLAYGRGRPMPLFRGSSSKVITAHLPTAKQRRLFESEQARGPARPDTDWQSLQEEASRIRRQGYCITRGELNRGIEGISAPLFLDGQVVGSITIIRDVSQASHLDEAALVGLVTGAAETIGVGTAGPVGVP